MNPNRCSRFRRSLSGALAAVLLLAGLLPAKAARAQGASPIPYTVAECGQIDESTLRDELNRIAQSIFDEERGGLSVAVIVERNWTALGLDATVDAAVDAATERVMDETGWWEKVISNWDPEELTTDVATYAFGSREFEEALEQLSHAIADDVVAEIQLMAVKSASSALDCVLTYLGDAVSPAMAAILKTQIEARFDGASVPSEGEVDWLDIAKAHPRLLGGVGVLIGTRIAVTLGKALAGQIAKRVVGRLLTRLVTGAIPLVGYLIGAALIIWDIFTFRNGSLPLIRDALKGPDIKREIRAEITRKFEDDLRTKTPQFARDIANDVFSQWLEFRRKHARVLELAQISPRFQAILHATPVDKVKPLGDLVALFDELLGEEGLLQAVESGQFERILHLPTEALDLLRATEDPDLVVAWADLAGARLSEVIELEVYRAASPSDFSDRAALEAILTLDDAALIQKLMALDDDARRTLLDLPSPQIEELLESVAPDDLAWLARELLPPLETRQRNQIVDLILRVPAAIQTLMALDDDARRTLLDLPSPQIEELLESVAPDDLAWLTRDLLPPLETRQRSQVVDIILSVPAALPELQVPAVRQALRESENFETTLNYIAQRTKDLHWVGRVVQMSASIEPLLSGELPWTLFLRYDFAALRSTLLVLAGLVLLYIAGRVVAPRRRQDVNVNVVLPDSRAGAAAEPSASSGEIRTTKEDGT